MFLEFLFCFFELIDISNQLLLLIIFSSWLGIKYSLEVDPLSLDLEEHFQCLTNNLQNILPTLNFFSESLIIEGSFLWWKNSDVIFKGSEYLIRFLDFVHSFLMFINNDFQKLPLGSDDK